MMAETKLIYPRYAVVRLRGIPTTPRYIARTLDLLRLRRKFTMVVVPGSPSIMGMIQEVNDWVTWGEIEADTLAEVLKKRGRIVGDKPLTLEYLKKWGWQSFEEVALAYVAGEIERLSCGRYYAREGQRPPCIPYLKPFFRLHPPRGGLNSVKLHFAAGGDLGYRGPLINDLIRRML
ncbi:50S ribosomal protein L30P, archaeal [Pyrobaculum oguniense TE7]|uniref:Large ribosomal subunit protein uL30 n=1 Tax=Pyrobaculum oguniense (strain DSM 13380 / JCM 10595 / TE7) TaxID=698757 RepID=H6QCR8_PYROT|nr:50S ribosomal protein L30P, archaeal [Pyrobaculum oguniense TE7]